MGFERADTKVDIGTITYINKTSSESLEYTVHLETYHQENEIGIGLPVFSFGFNSYTYIKGSRVICLLRDFNVKQFFILGQIYDPAISRGGFIPEPGEILLSSGGDDRSGILPLGKNDLFHAYTKKSFLKFDSEKINISINDTLKINGGQSFFSVTTDAKNSGFLLKDGVFNISAVNGFNLFSNDGAIYIKGQRFGFYEGANKTKPDFLISNGLHRQIGSELLHIFGIYSFEAGSSKVKGKTYAVDWNVIQGSYGIRLGTGDFKINLTNLSGAEVSFKIGQGPVYLSQFIFDESALEVKIGTALPDSLKLGGGSLAVKVGNIPGLQTELLLEGSNAELKVKGVVGSSTYTQAGQSMKFESSGSSGSATLEIASGKLTLKSASKATGGKIILDGEVEITGSLLVKGDDGVEVSKDIIVKGDTGITVKTGDVKAGATSISLKNHKHASSVPGGPTPPTPG